MASSSAAVVAAVLVVVLLGMGWPAPAAAGTTACEDCPTNCSSTCSHNINSQASASWLDCTGNGPCGPPPDPDCVQSCKSKAPSRCADARCKRQCATCRVSRQECRELIDMFIGVCTKDCTTRCESDCVHA